MIKNKKEFTWLILCILLSILIVGIVTKFQFQTFDVQLYDTYYVFGSGDAIKVLACLLIISKYTYLLIAMMTERYMILALLIAIINPIAALLMAIFTYLLISAILTRSKTLPDNGMAGNYLVLMILIAVLIHQTLIEIKMLRKLRSQFR